MIEQVKQYLVDIILRIMNDDDPLVRLRILNKIPIIAADISYLCKTLTESLKLCLIEPNWRVRKGLNDYLYNFPHIDSLFIPSGIVVVLPSILHSLGIDYFSEHYLSTYLKLFKDAVNEVRQAAAEVVGAIISPVNSNGKLIEYSSLSIDINTSISMIGPAAASLTTSILTDFVLNHVFPTIKPLFSDEYLIRLNLLSVLFGLLQIHDLSETFRNDIITLLISASSDKVSIYTIFHELFFILLPSSLCEHCTTGPEYPHTMCSSHVVFRQTLILFREY